jgi:hypothetical protein
MREGGGVFINGEIEVEGRGIERNRSEREYAL